MVASETSFHGLLHEWLTESTLKAPALCYLVLALSLWLTNHMLFSEQLPNPQSCPDGHVNASSVNTHASIHSHPYFWCFTLHWTFFSTKICFHKHLGYANERSSEHCRSWFVVSIQINVSEAFWNSYNHQHILPLPVTQIQRGITCVTLNMQIVSVAYRFTYAIIFLADPGAGCFLLMFTLSLPFSEILFEILRYYMNSK